MSQLGKPSLHSFFSQKTWSQTRAYIIQSSFLHCILCNGPSWNTRQGSHWHENASLTVASPACAAFRMGSPGHAATDPTGGSRPGSGPHVYESRPKVLPFPSLSTRTSSPITTHPTVVMAVAEFWLLVLATLPLQVLIIPAPVKEQTSEVLRILSRTCLPLSEIPRVLSTHNPSQLKLPSRPTKTT